MKKGLCDLCGSKPIKTFWFLGLVGMKDIDACEECSLSVREQIDILIGENIKEGLLDGKGVYI